MAIHNYKGLYREWGKHMSNTGVKYFRVARVRDRLEWRNSDRYYNKLKKRVYGRAFRTYMKIAKLQGLR